MKGPVTKIGECLRSSIQRLFKHEQIKKKEATRKMNNNDQTKVQPKCSWAAPRNVIKTQQNKSTPEVRRSSEVNVHTKSHHRTNNPRSHMKSYHSKNLAVSKARGEVKKDRICSENAEFSNANLNKNSCYPSALTTCDSCLAVKQRDRSKECKKLHDESTNLTTVRLTSVSSCDEECSQKFGSSTHFHTLTPSQHYYSEAGDKFAELTCSKECTHAFIEPRIQQSNAVHASNECAKLNARSLEKRDVLIHDGSRRSTSQEGCRGPSFNTCKNSPNERHLLKFYPQHFDQAFLKLSNVSPTFTQPYHEDDLCTTNVCTPLSGIKKSSFRKTKEYGDSCHKATQVELINDIPSGQISHPEVKFTMKEKDHSESSRFVQQHRLKSQRPTVCDKQTSCPTSMQNIPASFLGDGQGLDNASIYKIPRVKAVSLKNTKANDRLWTASKKLCQNLPTPNEDCEEQMIHHNCTAITKEFTEQRLQKSEIHKQHTLFPQSTSDDGDAVAQISKSTDEDPHPPSNEKNAHPQNLRKPSLEGRNSVPPDQPRKLIRHGGALPPSNNPNQCPTGRHLDSNSEKPCICLLVKRMVIEQSKEVISDWHSTEQISVTFKVSQPAINEHSNHEFRSNLEGTANANPKLTSFQLAKPTRMVRGGQGTVAWVTDTKTGHFYALKFKQREGRSDSTWEIEKREAELLKQTKHEFIVKLYHIYETEETIFMALEWLDGGCLWNHIARFGTMPECYVVYYAACILTALRYLHERSVVYRDMKAENIVLDNRGRPKLIDFGMAKRFGSKSEQINGSLEEPTCNDSEDFDDPPTRYYFAAYLAPEIYDSSITSQPWIDSWGLGYILVEMLLGYGIFLPMPWENESGKHLAEDWRLNLPRDATAQLSSICKDFIHKMLLRNPTDRMSLNEAQKHNLFSRVPWTNLTELRGPDLSKCNIKGGTASRLSNVYSGQKKWAAKQDSVLHIPDLAFVREFYGTVINPNVLYATQKVGLCTRRGKLYKTCTGQSLSTTNGRKSVAKDNEHSRSSLTDISTKQNHSLGNAVEIRNCQSKSRPESKH